MTQHFPGKVRIIGAGLTGLLAAFEAHRLGARDIELHDRHEQLGGSAWPRLSHGLEIREQSLTFGPPGDPVRGLLEGAGLAFEDFELRRGAVSPAPGGDMDHRRDFPGPALRTRDLALHPLAGDSLADRLRAYPHDIGHALSRYGQWALGGWLDQVHASAAEALGVRRVHPQGVDCAELCALKRLDSAADELYGVPAAQWGRLEGLTASAPRDGHRAFFGRARLALAQLGVVVYENALIAPHATLAGRAPGEVMVWAADPMPLFRPLGVEAPAAAPRTVFTYVFKVRHGAAAPVEVRNFTAEGVVQTLRLYESRGQQLVAADCIAEAGDGELRREVHRLMAGFCGSSLQLGESVALAVSPRWDCPSVEAVKKLRALRAALARTQGAAFVAPMWETQKLGDRFAALAAGLAQALTTDEAARAA